MRKYVHRLGEHDDEIGVNEQARDDLRSPRDRAEGRRLHKQPDHKVDDPHKKRYKRRYRDGIVLLGIIIELDDKERAHRTAGNQCEQTEEMHAPYFAYVRDHDACKH